jgi:hypothetical protein
MAADAQERVRGVDEHRDHFVVRGGSSGFGRRLHAQGAKRPAVNFGDTSSCGGVRFGRGPRDRVGVTPSLSVEEEASPASS